MKPILEKVPSDLRQSFYCGTYKKKKFNTPWHYHPHWELTYIKKGEGVSYIGNTIRHFLEGEIVLLGSNLPHCWRSDEGETRGVESIFIQWDENMLGEGWIKKPEFIAIENLLNSSRSGLLFDSSQTEKIKQQIESLNSENNFANLCTFLNTLQELSEIPAQPITNASDFQVDSRMTTRIESIIKFVEQNYADKITSQDLSELTHMTPTSFSKFFKRTFNKTFTSYLNELRVSKACGLIRQTDHSIEDIAHDCGYNNMAFFHRQFRQVVGITPLNYRKSFQIF